MPSFGVMPLATRQALYLLTLPFDSLLVLNIHLQSLHLQAIQRDPKHHCLLWTSSHPLWHYDQDIFC